MLPFCVFSSLPKSWRVTCGNNTGNWEDWRSESTLTFLAESQRRSLAEGTQHIPPPLKFLIVTCLNISPTTRMTSLAIRHSSEPSYLQRELRQRILIFLLGPSFVRSLAARRRAHPEKN